MKASKLTIALGILWVALAGLGVFLGAAWEASYTRSLSNGRSSFFPGDLNSRIYEVQCSHQGINPFHIWNQDIAVPGYCPRPRPDMPIIQPKPGDRSVHAYPVWHTVYFWFYGWLPENASVELMACLFGLCLAGIFCYFKKLYVGISCCPSICVIAVLAMVSTYLVDCFVWMNYSVLILAVLVLMVAALSCGQDCLAGLLWGIAMIKPQMALLFVWPLFFERKYWTIAIGTLTCLVSTGIMSLYYVESPIALVLQTFQLGQPYASSFFDSFLKIGGGQFQMTLFFALCGYLCWLMRDSKVWVYRWAPVALCVPYWTYSQPYDHVILAIWYCVVAIEVCKQTTLRKLWIVYALVSVIAYFGQRIWDVAVAYKLFSPTGIGCLYRGVGVVWLGFTVLMCVLLARRCSNLQEDCMR